MILDISAFFTNAGKEESRKVHIDADSFDSKMGSFPILDSKPFMLQITNVENKRLLLRGEAQVTVAIPCDRCLSEVPTTLSLSIDREIPLEEGKAAEGDVDDAREWAEYLDGHKLEIDRLVYGEILLAWPMKVLCKDDCKGICWQCGVNLNEQTCSCDRTVPDPRMAAFQDVFNKFKEV